MNQGLQQLIAVVQALKTELGKVIIGQQEVIDRVLVALLTGQHALIEGVPGIGKTLLVRTLAKTLGGRFARIQFTPDLMPADITGTNIFNMKDNEFVLNPGPIFCNFLLADEINRAPAKTQSALLEAMQERQVTIEGETQALPDPFLVLATQNPVEQEGVYLLPEAQIDRFLVRIRLDYPSAADEARMLRTYDRPVPAVTAVASVHDLIRVADLVDAVHVEEKVMAYIVRLVHATRHHPRVALGASPRASLGLMRLAKAWALLAGREFVTPDDVRGLLGPVLEHRVMVTTDAAIEGVTAAAVVADVAARTKLVDSTPGAVMASELRVDVGPSAGRSPAGALDSLGGRS